MNERSLRPANVAAAALLLGGVLMAVFPQHAPSIVRVIIVSIAAAAGLYALIVHISPAWWHSPFDRTTAEVAGPADEVDWVRAALAGRRQRQEGGPPLPPAILRLLQPLVQAAVERQGSDPADRLPLSPLTAHVLATKPLRRASWWRTIRPDARLTARVVHRVLDELDRGTGPRPAPNTLPLRE